MREIHIYRGQEDLYEALLALRLRKEPRYLWVDAICIDQKNIQERNQQVPRMDSIYGGATGVCVWLGRGSTASDAVIDFIKSDVNIGRSNQSIWDLAQAFSLLFWVHVNW